MAGDGPEYGWLYGGKGGDGPADPAADGAGPEATRPIRRPDRRAAPPLRERTVLRGVRAGEGGSGDGREEGAEVTKNCIL